MIRNVFSDFIVEYRTELNGVQGMRLGIGDEALAGEAWIQCHL